MRFAPPFQTYCAPVFLSVLRILIQQSIFKSNSLDQRGGQGRPDCVGAPRIAKIRNMKTTRYSFKVLGCAAVLFVAGGCSLLQSRSKSAASNAIPETRDVPFQARDSRETMPRKRVMVLPFIDQGATRSEKVALIAREAFVRRLVKTDDFVVISNSDYPKDLNSYLKNGEYDLEGLAKLANGMGLAAIIEGKIIEVRAKRIGDSIGLVREVRAKMDATVSLRMAAAKNAKIVLNEMRSATLEDSTTRVAERAFSDKYLEEDPKLVEGAVLLAFKGTVPRILQSIDKLNWEGRIAMVKGDRVFLNAGRLTGLQVGDVLKITEDGEDVYDPETGVLIGRVPGRLKGTVEIISYFGKDGAVAVIHSGSGFRENDLVELY